MSRMDDLYEAMKMALKAGSRATPIKGDEVPVVMALIDEHRAALRYSSAQALVLHHGYHATDEMRTAKYQAEDAWDDAVEKVEESRRALLSHGGTADEATRLPLKVAR